MKLHQKLFWLLILLFPVQLGRHLWPEWTYVLGLRVDYLAPTIYLTDILVAGILISWWWQAKSKYTLSTIRYALQKHWWILAVFIYLLTNSLLAQNPGAALYKFVKIIEFTLLGLYVAKSQYSVFSIQYPLILAVIYSFLIAIAQLLKQASLGGIFWWLGERTFTIVTPGIARAVVGGRLLMRPYATFPHPNVLAGVTLASMILIASNYKPYGIRQLAKWGALALGAVVIALSFSRSAWFVGLLCLFPVVYHLLPNRKRRIVISLPILLVLVGLFYFGFQFSTEEAINQRIQLIKVAARMIRTTPVVGVGLNNFIVRLPDFWTVQSIYWLQPVHNIFLLVAAEAGLVGLLVFLWLLYLTIIRAYRRQKFIILYSLVAILLLGLFDHYWLTLQQSQLLFTIFLGLSWAKKR